MNCLQVGLETLQDLWTLLGDLQVSVRTLLALTLARAVCLILLPVAVYLARSVLIITSLPYSRCSFSLHLVLLSHSGRDEVLLSPAYQASLVGSRLGNLTSPGRLRHGAVVTLRQAEAAGLYLHSHQHRVPGQQLQQVTAGSVYKYL